MPVTSKQIAMLAGVSRGTVDRALHGRGGVNREVELRIRAMAKELGYTPNRAGKALAIRKKPVSIGVVISSIGNAFFDEMIRGMNAAQAEYADFNLKVVIKKTRGYDVLKQLSLVDELVAEGVGALALTPIDDPLVAEKINGLAESGIPVVAVNSDIGNTRRIAYVGCDYQKSGATAAGLLGLVSGGNANVAVITGSKKILGHNQRVEGFLAAVRKDFPHTRIMDIAENNDNDVTSYLVTADLLREYPETDAFYFTAAGVPGGCKAITEHFSGRARPTVISCDCTEEIRNLMLRGVIQATVCQQPFQQGYQSVRRAFEAVLNKDFPPSEYYYVQNEILIKQNL